MIQRGLSLMCQTDVCLYRFLLSYLFLYTIYSIDKQGECMSMNNETEIAVFAGGCFWCLEAVFSMFEGILSIVPGYTGGHLKNPSYEEVCTGETDHAEAIKITFNPSSISYRKLLEVFFTAHDPTSYHRQGADIGSQYRSAIFFTSPSQENEIQDYLEDIKINKIYEKPIVTEILPLDTFYEAEKYHHNYFEKNPHKAYCQMAIRPKVTTVKKLFR